MNNNRGHILSTLFVLTVFLANIFSATIFVHTHEIDGVKVAHSHPFTSKTHNHSTNQFVALHFTVATQGLTSDAVNVEDADRLLIGTVYVRVADGHAFFTPDCRTLRAPPCC